MATQVVTTDSWLAQSVGGTKEYGNGTNGLIHVGPVPASSSGSPDYKSRGIYEVSLTSVLTGLTSITSGLFTAVVGPNTCMGSRGGNINILLEEVTTAFNNKTATGDCGLSSGTGLGVWSISNSINIADRAFHSSTSHVTGDLLTWDITALIARKLAEGATVLRFRLIAALASGTGYDEATAGRRIALYSVRDASSGNRPFITVTGSTGSVAKSASQAMVFTEKPSTKSVIGNNTVDSDEQMFFDEVGYVDIAPTWSTLIDTGGRGIGQVIMPEPGKRASVLLPGAVASDCLLQCKFKINKRPIGDAVAFRLLARASSSGAYEVSIQMHPDNKMGIVLTKRTGGFISTVLNSFIDNDTLIVGDWYWVKFQVINTFVTTVSAKLWSEKVAEPNWELFAQDAEPSLQVPGSVGLGVQTFAGTTNQPFTINFDEFTGLSL
jgi:hypothetical protein